jgi:hypothetical protein
MADINFNFIMIIAGAFSDKKGLPVKNWQPMERTMP